MRSTRIDGRLLGPIRGACPYFRSGAGTGLELEVVCSSRVGPTTISVTVAVRECSWPNYIFYAWRVWASQRLEI